MARNRFMDDIKNYVADGSPIKELTNLVDERGQAEHDAERVKNKKKTKAKNKRKLAKISKKRNR